VRQAKRAPKVTVGSDYRFEQVRYVPVALRRRTGMVWVRCSDVEVHRPDASEQEWIADRLVRGDVHVPLGFPEPPTLENVESGWLPDLSLPGRLIQNRRGYREPAEFLVIASVRDGQVSDPSPQRIGFCIIYEQTGPGDPNQEIDLALTPVGPPAAGSAEPPTLREKTRRIRGWELCLLAYLFALCGARSVAWERVGESRARTPGQVDLVEFKRRLGRRGACVPVILLESPGHTQRDIGDLG